MVTLTSNDRETDNNPDFAHRKKIPHALIGHSYFASHCREKVVIAAPA